MGFLDLDLCQMGLCLVGWFEWLVEPTILMCQLGGLM